MKSILNELAKQQGSPMLSIIISTNMKSFSEKGKIKLKLKNGISLAEKELKQKFGEENTKKLIRSANSLTKQINLDHVEKGIGIYVSPGFEKLVSFPFAVQDKVVVDNFFEISDIHDNLDQMVEYSVMLMSRHMVRLFKGLGNKIEEVEDSNFPFLFEDQFQVARTSPHSLYNMEESEIDQARLDNYYRKVEKLLSTYTKENPVIIMGGIKSMSDFRTVRKNKYKVLAEISGNFDKFKVHEVSHLILPEIEKYIEERKALPLT